MHTEWTPNDFSVVGFLLDMLDDADPRPARVQLDAHYQHGGGWITFEGFDMLPNGNLKYPGDPPTRPVAETKLRDERVVLYEHGWVAIIQPDGSYEVARMD